MPIYFSRKTVFLSLFLILGIVHGLQAQSIQVMPSATSSNSTLLSDYYGGKQTGLSVTLMNIDSSQPFLQGYLRITIEGQGVKLQSGSYGNYNSIDLLEGNPVTLGPSELAAYFKPQQLQGSIGFGMNQANIFPEGFYQFCFEVLEKNTSRLIGSQQCAQANLYFSEPVELVFPEKGKTIEVIDPFRLLFQWKPQHTNLSTSEYTFTLMELEDDGKVTDATFGKGKQIYTTKLSTTKLIYGEHEPALVKGKTYAWRVQATATNAMHEQEPIKNEGYSEVYWFKY